MVSMALILGLSAAIIGALAVFWKDIVGWIKKAANKIKEVLGVTVEGTRTFIVRTQEGFKNKSKYYNKNKLTNEWEETTYTKQVSEADIPPEIMAKVRAQSIGVDVSTTEELRLALNA
jgi:hypothetical protein